MKKYGQTMPGRITSTGRLRTKNTKANQPAHRRYRAKRLYAGDRKTRTPLRLPPQVGCRKSLHGNTSFLQDLNLSSCQRVHTAFLMLHQYCTIFDICSITFCRYLQQQKMGVDFSVSINSHFRLSKYDFNININI